MLNCIVRSDRPVDSEISRLLYRKAREMAGGKKKKSLKFKSSECQGVLTTLWESRNVGSYSGVEFTAEFADRLGENTATFIIRSFELEDIGVLVAEHQGPEEEVAMVVDQMEAASQRRAGRLN